MKLLEESLSGYIPPIERHNEDIEDKKAICSKINPSTLYEAPQIDIEPSALDHVIWLRADKEECLRRSFGRRIDTQGIDYHISQFRENQYQHFSMSNINDDIPPSHILPLVETLIPEENYSAHRGALVDRMIAQDREAPSLESWFNQFGTNNKPLMVRLDSNKPILEVANEFEEIIDKLLMERQLSLELEEQEKENYANQENERIQAIQDKINAKRETLLMLDEDEREQHVAEPTPKHPKETPRENVEGLWDLWDEFQEQYVSILKSVFRMERQQRTDVTQQLRQLQLWLLKFLARPCEKQQLLTDFQQDFNQFTDDNLDMREDDATICELQQRVEDLSHKLWDIVDRRQAEAEAELQEIQSSGWIEYHLDRVAYQTVQLLLAEWNRFTTASIFLSDYYCSLDRRPLYKLEFPQMEFNLDDNPHDSIQKLSEKLLAVPQPALVDEKDDGKKPKKEAPKGKKAPVQEEEVVHRTPAQDELDQAMHKEYQVFQSRISRLQSWSLSRLQEVESTFQEIFSRMAEWIHAAAKTEALAIYEIGNVIRDAVEAQTKIQPLLELNTLDAIVRPNCKTFEPPPPIPLSPQETPTEYAFTISQLDSIIEELQVLPDKCDKNVIIRMLQRRKRLTQLLQPFYGLPEGWIRVNDARFIDLVNEFDKDGSGFIEWKDFVNSIVLANSLPVADNDLNNLLEQLPMSIDEFEEVPAWFDPREGNLDHEKALPFPRVRHIKKLLFRVNCGEGILTRESLEKLNSTVNVIKIIQA